MMPEVRIAVLPPSILDQSFPRNVDELSTVAICLGEIESCLQSGRLRIISTNVFTEFLSDFEWCNRGEESYPLLHDIYNFLSYIFTNGREYCHIIDTQSVAHFTNHCLPSGCEPNGLAAIWQDETGRLLSLHDAHTTDDRYFIGIACAEAFSKAIAARRGHPGDGGRAFPLVGPVDLQSLACPFEWEVRDEDIRGEISVALARRNIAVLGGEVREPPESSHQKIRFSNSDRPWILDRNVDPLPHRFLKQLESISGYPYQVVRYALLHGELPNYRFRLRRYEL